MRHTDDDASADQLERLFLERARQGDEQAFAELVRLHQDQLYGVAVRMTGDRQAAEEVVQDALVQAWQHLSGFRADSRFATWVTRIVINRCLNARRGARPPGDVPVEDQEWRLPAAAGAEEQVMRRQRQEAVRQAVASLPFDQRAALVLTVFAGHSYSEAAGILGTSESTVKVRAHRGRRALADRLREWR